jgi:L-methionine (R)-S-oxide reductase
VQEELLTAVRHAAAAEGTPEERAARAAALIRARTGRRWVGIYEVGGGWVRNLAWSGPGPPAHPSFSSDRGLTGAAIRTRRTVISNDVARDRRYLTNQDSTGSELIVPVVVAGTVVGTLDVEAAERNAFDDGDRALFEAVAGALAGLYDRPTRP